MKLKLFFATCLMVFSVISYAGTVMVTTHTINNKPYKSNIIGFIPKINGIGDGYHYVFNKFKKSGPDVNYKVNFNNVNSFNIDTYSLEAKSSKTPSNCKTPPLHKNDFINVDLRVTVAEDGTPVSGAAQTGCQKSDSLI